MNKEVEKQVEETTVEETTEVVDVEKVVQSERSKAKFEVLNELGIKNVKDGKTLVEKGMQYDETATKLSEIQVELETLQQENSVFKSEKKYNDTSIKLMADGFNPERLEGIKPLVDNEKTVEENVENIRELFPELFIQPKKSTTTTPRKSETQDAKTEAQKYFERQMNLQK